jgi:hypothetical protein
MPIANFDKVELLLPMTGANNGTVFTDRSLRQRTVTRTGAVTSTAQSKFAAYGSSGLWSADAQYLTVTDVSNITTESAFQVSMWVYLTGIGSIGRYLASQQPQANNSGAWVMHQVFSTGELRFFIGNSAGTLQEIVSAAAIPLNEWVHVSAGISGGNLFCRIGSALTSAALTITPSANSEPLYIGGRAGGGTNDARSIRGNIQDFTLYKGVAPYASSYTAPDRMTQRTLTRANTGTDSHEYDRAVLFDWNAGGGSNSKAVIPDNDGNFAATDLIDLEYGVAFIRDECSPVCRGPVEVDAD